MSRCRFPVRLVFALLAWATAGCAGPTMELRVAPPAALVYVDGRQVARPEPGAPVKLPVGYYGTRLVRSREPAGQSESRLQDARAALVVDEPFSPWFFPLDFVLEATTWPFAGDRYRHEFAVELAPRPEVVDGTTPEGLEAIREAARRAVAAR